MIPTPRLVWRLGTLDCLAGLVPIFFKERKMTMAKGFGKGFLTGVLSTVAATAGAIYAIQKIIIEPEEKKEAFIEENRKKAARRRIAH